MGKSPFCEDVAAIEKQFDCICKLALKGEATDFFRHISYRQRHEVLFSELSEAEWDRLFMLDEYAVEQEQFQVSGCDVVIRNTLLAEALKALSDRQRDMVFLFYFLGYSDSEIAERMNVVRSTVFYHRKRALARLRKIMEGQEDEE